jgi:hypothetical protein
MAKRRAYIMTLTWFAICGIIAMFLKSPYAGYIFGMFAGSIGTLMVIVAKEIRD